MVYRIFQPPELREILKQKPHTQTAAFVLYYHFVVSTKKRVKEFADEMRAAGMVDLLLRLCRSRDYLVIGVAVMPEHVPSVVSLKPDVAPATAIAYVKGAAARLYHREYGGEGALWSEGYAVEAVGHKNVHQVLSYIGRQDEHHENPPT